MGQQIMDHLVYQTTILQGFITSANSIQEREMIENIKNRLIDSTLHLIKRFK